MSRSSVYFKRSVMVGWDAVSWVLALVAFLLVRHDLSLSERVWDAAVAYRGAAIVLQVVAGFRFHLYLGRSRIGSFDEATVLGSLVAGIALILGSLYFLTQPVFSRGLAVAMPSLAFLFMAAGRWVFRALRDGRWKYLSVDGHDYLFDVEADERERANLAEREPERLTAMRQAWHAWNETMPPIPADATVSLGYSVANMPPR